MEPKCYLIGQVSKYDNKKAPGKLRAAYPTLSSPDVVQHGKDKKIVEVCNRKMERRI